MLQTAQSNLSITIFGQIKYFLLSLRPHQWTKNLLVFAAIIFSGNLFSSADLITSATTFVLFCIASGSIYIFNDIIDRTHDANHPEKRTRPIAAGLLSLTFAAVGGFALMIIAVMGSFLVHYQVGLVISGYILMTCIYSIKLKQIVILDLIIVALGFVLRAIAGGLAIQVTISPWLLVCTFFLALFLVIGKRRHELISLKENSANHRKILEEYNPKLLDQMMAVVTASTIVAYALYTHDHATVQRFQTANLIYTIPFVIFGVFRYFYLIYKREVGGRPESILLNDRGILAAVLSWIIVVCLIIYHIG